MNKELKSLENILPALQDNVNKLNYTTPDPNQTRGIAVILMPLVGEEENTETVTLYQFLNFPNGYIWKGARGVEWEIDETQQDAALSLITASTLRLFLAGIIHMDLHTGNSLIYYDDDRRLYSRIIDFGSSCIFTDNRNTNKFLDRGQKTRLTELLDKYKNRGNFLKLDNQTNTQEKIAIVLEVMNLLEYMDTAGNTKVFGTGQSQMGSWWDILKRMSRNDKARYDKIIAEAYNIVREGIKSSNDRKNKTVAELTRLLPPKFTYTQSIWAAPPPLSPPPARGPPRERLPLPPAVKKQAPAQGWFTAKNAALVAILGFSIYYYLNSCSGENEMGENEMGDYGGSKMNGGQAITIETIKDYVNSNNLQDMLVEMVQTESCPIGDNKIHAQKILEMMNTLPEDQRQSATLGELIGESYIQQQQQQEIGGRRRRNRKTRTKKQRKTRRR